MPDESAIGLATFLEGLRSELKTSMDNAKRDRSLAFQLTKLDVELQVTAEMSADGSGKVKFWVVEVGAGAKGSNKSVQTIKLVNIVLVTVLVAALVTLLQSGVIPIFRAKAAP